MATPSDYTDEQIAEAIEYAGGYMLGIARKLDCKPESIRARIMQDPTLREVLYEQQEQVSDNAEKYLVEAINARKSWAIKYWLSRKGRNRGYGQKLEVEAKVDSDSRVVVYLPDDGREASESDDNGDSTAAGAAGHCTPQ